MSSRERLIAGIHHQKDALNSLISLLQGRNELTKNDCCLYEITTKEVEKNLKKLRRLALHELIKEITTEQNYTMNREEILE